jgi:hypothetical protein
MIETCSDLYYFVKDSKEISQKSSILGLLGVTW